MASTVLCLVFQTAQGGSKYVSDTDDILTCHLFVWRVSKNYLSWHFVGIFFIFNFFLLNS